MRSLYNCSLRSILLILTLFALAECYCEPHLDCDECQLIHANDACQSGTPKQALFFCDKITNQTRVDPTGYFECQNERYQVLHCPQHKEFALNTQQCEGKRPYKGKKRSSGSRTGDTCAFNTDCQRGMFCSMGVCICLSDYIAIGGYCWPKVNPGESGCVEDQQCEAVWPASRCSSTGMCECPPKTAPARTRDGTVCVPAGVPPACPLPEPANVDMPNPSAILANPTTHPLNPNTYMPVLCTSSSTEIRSSNGGDGSSWCVYPDGDNDIYIADIYNCVPHPQVNSEFFPEYANSVDGICCHSRAFVCIQPLEQGDEPSIPRWWYNSITGTCSQFLWDPNQADSASPNNFRTMEHCESYCRDTCRRGPTQFTESKWSILDDAPVSNCLHSTTACSSQHSCDLIGSHQTCCPTVAHVCSLHGGRPLFYQPLDNYDRGVAIAGSKTISRYYYDVEQGRCLTFLYDGLGNYNNFATKQDCENFCSKLVCENGNPLRIGDEWQRCESNTDCPSSHQCEVVHKVCCPTAQSICTQPKRLGDCTNSVRRYWYNAGTRQCEMFSYTGCQGNDNNFDSLISCQQKCRNIVMEPMCPQGRAHRNINGLFTTCNTKSITKSCPPNYECNFDGSTHGCCPTKAHTCSLSSDKGVQCGAGKSFRYYFNTNKQTCESFQYEGCDGNPNNFQSLEECQDYCGVGGCPNGGQPLRDVATNQFTTCTESSKCPATHECVSINVNGNMAQRCCPTKAHICSLPPQQGNQCAKMSITRFYFNIVTKECSTFGFNGCNGNLNNFGSLDHCKNFCSSAACHPGEIAYKDVNTKRVIECSAQFLNSCPPDYTCRYDSLSSKHVCCGTPPSNFCPEGEKTFVNAADESIKECAINMPGSCPANYLCRFSAVNNRYYCCASTAGNVCPDGRALYRETKTLQPLRCSLNNVYNGCPNSYSCQSRSAGVLQGYCCSAQPVCRIGGEFLVDERTQMPKICTPGAFISCPPGYRCQKTPGATTGYCCKGGETTAVTEGCPPGEYAYSIRRQIVSCDPFNPKNMPCPDKYSCQYAVSFQRYQCCGKEPIEEDEVMSIEQGCPVGQIAYTPEGVSNPMTCTASSPQSCPMGYFCQFSERNKQFQCCGHKAGCPLNSVAYVDMTGNAKECKPNLANQCPQGYVCQMTEKQRFVCCTADSHETFPSTTTSTTTQTPQRTTRYEEFASSTTEAPEEFIEETTTTKPDAPARGINTHKCPIDQLWKDGECVPRQIGDPCVLQVQCPVTTQCISFLCACPKNTREVDGRCVTITKLTPTQAPAVNCPPGHVRYQGKCYKKMELTDSCEISQQCVNGSICRENACVCPKNTVGYKGRCVASICGVQSNKEPHRDSTTMATVCTQSPCTSPYKCTYSKVVKDYICCKSSSSTEKRNRTGLKTKNSASAKSAKTCPDGSTPYLFPRTTLPLSCAATGKCPGGFYCTNNICCRTKAASSYLHDQVLSDCENHATDEQSSVDPSFKIKCVNP